ncbi:MAG: penicillin-binding protein 2 [Bacteroidales bacterium]|nr:penicillin-binding protein 2 [Bacteroidales bacterium]
MDKKVLLITGIIVVALCLAARMFWLQIIDDHYKVSADNNALLYQTQYPARGEIKDRNGNILVGNKTTYDIMVTPVDIEEFDTIDFCLTFHVDINDVRKKLKYYRENKRKIGYQTFTFIKQVPSSDYSHYAEKAYKFPGFYAISRTARVYPYEAGASLYGYINEADSAYLANNPEYRRGDYVGITGIERSYEDVLRGKKGYNIMVRDVHNRIRQSFKNGEYDVAAEPGKDLIASIDGPLQQYGEWLMKDKVGSIVAIEPSTGEILAIVSSPGLTVNDLSNIRKEYGRLASDPYKPMFNRAVMSAYPPGSVFKTVNALIGQQNGVITPDTKFSCSRGFYYAGGKMGCHGHRSPLNLRESIMMSCNAYYANVFRAIMRDPNHQPISDAFDHWKEQVQKFGIGVKLGSDFPSELQGNLPSTKTYDKIHGKGKWSAFNILSLAIGQGEVGATPLQIANLAATIANKGYYIIPHLIRNAPDSLRRAKYTEKHWVGIDQQHFDPVIEGMYLAVNAPPGAGGTSRRAYIDDIVVCGKTGTAQNPHGRDNSVFMCFAPRENPKIAVCVYLENSGAGGTWAAPVASLIVEKYLRGEVKRTEFEQMVHSTNLKQYVPVKRKK